MIVVWRFLVANSIDDDDAHSAGIKKARAAAMPVQAPKLPLGLVGTSGVGKSELIILFGVYMAVQRQHNVLISRKSSGRGGRPDTVIVLCGCQVIKFPDFARENLAALVDEFKRKSLAENKSFLIIGDGYRQEESNMHLPLFSFIAAAHIISTSGQFQTMPGGARVPVLVPAWSKESLELVAERALEATFKDRYAYSGGSIREFLREPVREPSAAQAEIGFHLTEAAIKALQHNTEGPTNSKIDTFRQMYVGAIDNYDHYVNGAHWRREIKTKYVGWLLTTMASLKFSVSILMWAEAWGGALYGWVFESFVHKLASEGQLKLRVLDYSSFMWFNLSATLTIDDSFTVVKGPTSQEGCLKHIATGLCAYT
ncbi:hypothetical protein SDRG_02712 [Saprolegnia diclina VS20]|uniref:Uncharacterized protein n=1 Tax=Saprolegnia diclina (strain VS20) TaxID=1156394 RepID=T0SBD9_SAPDV|nr:hypothetical protein SDRG_02712 [Saprolegnia diclina VS20]EQC40057.1 hypothetical protein SDRG_02712 [Saprolegnia diclina VS20]|eukprot:XP_008606531.1 hypothetical protein SDRG_02712 [Saprolegnia diclina VS20]